MSEDEARHSSYPYQFIEAAKHLQRERNGEGVCDCRSCQQVRLALVPVGFPASATPEEKEFGLLTRVFDDLKHAFAFAGKTKTPHTREYKQLAKNLNAILGKDVFRNLTLQPLKTDKRCYDAEGNPPLETNERSYDDQGLGF
jgi:hypothetical protein